MKNDPHPTVQSCMALDKWGEHNCLRPRGHEENRADHRAAIHRSRYSDGRVYEWVGAGTSREVSR